MSRQTVDPHGTPIKLSDRQKDVLYKKAQKLRERIQDNICNKRELHDPSRRNVNKMLYGEMKSNKIIGAYKDHMEAIGADPKDYSIEKMRRR